MDLNLNEPCCILPEDYPHYDFSFKVIVIGNSGVGKSCLSIKATKNIFESNYVATIGFEFFTFNVKIKDKVIKLQIWDTCGQEIYRSLVSNLYKNTALAVIVYAVDDLNSFKDIDMWLQDLKTHSSPDAKVFLIGNKIDLEDKRVVNTSVGKAFKEEYNMDMFMETSAKTGFNARQLFVSAAQLLYDDFIKYKKTVSFSSDSAKKNESYSLRKECVKKKRSCC